MRVTGGLIKGDLDRDTHWLLATQDEGGAALPITAKAGTARHLGGEAGGSRAETAQSGKWTGSVNRGWGKRECLLSAPPGMCV